MTTTRLLAATASAALGILLTVPAGATGPDTAGRDGAQDVDELSLFPYS